MEIGESPLYTEKCLEFSRSFKGKQGLTTFQSENKEAHYFSGTVYVNHLEFVCMDELKEGDYMVYINNPEGYEGKQLVFGYYKSFRRALNRVASIAESRKYPKPIEIW